MDLWKDMQSEREYSERAGSEHLNAYGQFFTPKIVAEYMTAWALKNAGSLLDPAVGNGVFFQAAQGLGFQGKMTGYEIDPEILDAFAVKPRDRVNLEDYLRADWDDRYDAILCNPPYRRFRRISEREELVELLWEKTQVRCSTHSNLYLFFLLKAIRQMSEHGRLAFLIPTEFLNAGYGTTLKELLLKERLIRGILYFAHDSELFFNATTTGCVLLLDREPKGDILLVSVQDSKELLAYAEPERFSNVNRIDYDRITAAEKWQPYLNGGNGDYDADAVPTGFCRLKDLGSVKRGIATGDNDYFCFTEEKRQKYGLNEDRMQKCVCRSRDVSGLVFTKQDFIRLREAGKQVYLPDFKEPFSKEEADYLEYGKETGVDLKNLPLHRKVWYRPEKREAAPIWISSACRDGIRVIRNLTDVRPLTTFHYFYPAEGVDPDLLFCILNAPCVQEYIRRSGNRLGNELDKYQPGDLMEAWVPNPAELTEDEKEQIKKICKALQRTHPEKKKGQGNDREKALLQELDALLMRHYKKAEETE